MTRLQKAARRAVVASAAPRAVSSKNPLRASSCTRLLQSTGALSRVMSTASTMTQAQLAPRPPTSSLKSTHRTSTSVKMVYLGSPSQQRPQPTIQDGRDTHPASTDLMFNALTCHCLHHPGHAICTICGLARRMSASAVSHSRQTLHSAAQCSSREYQPTLHSLRSWRKFVVAKSSVLHSSRPAKSSLRTKRQWARTRS